MDRAHKGKLINAIKMYSKIRLQQKKNGMDDYQK